MMIDQSSTLRLRKSLMENVTINTSLCFNSERAIDRFLIYEE